MEVRQPDKTIPIEVWGTPIYEEQSDIAYAIVAFADITKPKQAEEAIFKAEQKYRSIFEYADYAKNI